MIEIRINFDPATAGNLKNSETGRFLRETSAYLAALANDGAAPAEKATRGRPVTGKTEVALQADLAPAAAPDPAKEENLFDEPAATKDFTADDAKNAAKVLIDEKGTDPCKKILTDMGFKKVTDVPKEKFAEFISACETAAK